MWSQWIFPDHKYIEVARANLNQFGTDSKLEIVTVDRR
jgi:hypothetical protein